MSSNALGWAARRPLVLYMVLAYGFSWAVFVPLALQARGIIEPVLPGWMHYCASFGPALSAFVVTYRISGSRGLRELWSRMARWQVGLLWWVLAIAPIMLFLVIAALAPALGSERISLSVLGKADFLPDVGFWMLPLWFLTYGLGEETGWRGFVLPRLQHSASALKASLLVAGIWGLWHAPAFFYVYDPGILPGFALGLMAGSVMFTWLYNSTGGSILMVALLHATFNLTSGCTECKSGLVAAILSTVVMIWAVAVIVWFKPANLSHLGKHSLPARV